LGVELTFKSLERLCPTACKVGDEFVMHAGGHKQACAGKAHLDGPQTLCFGEGEEL
jgi:hypothetical protein